MIDEIFGDKLKQAIQRENQASLEMSLDSVDMNELVQKIETNSVFTPKFIRQNNLDTFFFINYSGSLPMFCDQRENLICFATEFDSVIIFCLKCGKQYCHRHFDGTIMNIIETSRYYKAAPSFRTSNMILMKHNCIVGAGLCKKCLEKNPEEMKHLLTQDFSMRHDINIDVFVYDKNIHLGVARGLYESSADLSDFQRRIKAQIDKEKQLSFLAENQEAHELFPSSQFPRKRHHKTIPPLNDDYLPLSKPTARTLAYFLSGFFTTNPDTSPFMPEAPFFYLKESGDSLVPQQATKTAQTSSINIKSQPSANFYAYINAFKSFFPIYNNNIYSHSLGSLGAFTASRVKYSEFNINFKRYKSFRGKFLDSYLSSSLQSGSSSFLPFVSYHDLSSLWRNNVLEVGNSPAWIGDAGYESYEYLRMETLQSFFEPFKENSMLKRLLHHLQLLAHASAMVNRGKTKYLVQFDDFKNIEASEIISDYPLFLIDVSIEKDTRQFNQIIGMADSILGKILTKINKENPGKSLNFAANSFELIENLNKFQLKFEFSAPPDDEGLMVDFIFMCWFYFSFFGRVSIITTPTNFYIEILDYYTHNKGEPLLVYPTFKTPFFDNEHSISEIIIEGHPLDEKFLSDERTYEDAIDLLSFHIGHNVNDTILNNFGINRLDLYNLLATEEKLDFKRDPEEEKNKKDALIREKQLTFKIDPRETIIPMIASSALETDKFTLSSVVFENKGGSPMLKFPKIAVWNPLLGGADYLITGVIKTEKKDSSKIKPKLKKFIDQFGKYGKDLVDPLLDSLIRAYVRMLKVFPVLHPAFENLFHTQILQWQTHFHIKNEHQPTNALSTFLFHHLRVSLLIKLGLNANAKIKQDMFDFLNYLGDKPLLMWYYADLFYFKNQSSFFPAKDAKISPFLNRESFIKKNVKIDAYSTPRTVLDENIHLILNPSNYKLMQDLAILSNEKPYRDVLYALRNNPDMASLETPRLPSMVTIDKACLISKNGIDIEDQLSMDWLAGSELPKEEDYEGSPREWKEKEVMFPLPQFAALLKHFNVDLYFHDISSKDLSLAIELMSNILSTHLLAPEANRIVEEALPGG